VLYQSRSYTGKSMIRTRKESRHSDLGAGDSVASLGSWYSSPLQAASHPLAAAVAARSSWNVFENQKL